MQIVITSATGRVIVSIMSCDRSNISVKLGVKEMKRVQSEHEAEKGARVINEVLHRVHGKAGPRSRIVALVMKAVNSSVKERTNVALRKTVLDAPPRMYQAMHPVEVKLPPVGDQEQVEHGVEGVIPEIEVHRDFAGSPKIGDDDLIGRGLKEPESGEEHFTLEMAGGRTQVAYLFGLVGFVLIYWIEFLGSESFGIITHISNIMPEPIENELARKIVGHNL